MNCREFEPLMLDLVRNQMPEAATPAQVLQHLEQCADCAARLAQERRLRASLQLVAEDIAQQEAPAFIEANLLAALHAQAEHKPAPSFLTVFTRGWSWQFAAVAVAALLLVALFVFGRSSQEQTVQQMPAPPNAPAPPTEQAKDNAAIPAEPQQVRAATPRVPPRRRVRPPQPAAPEEIAAPFYSLVAEGEMAPLESGRIVRIEVPAAALVKWGVPLTETNLAQPMQADLLLGQDGLARAIRFVPFAQSTRTQ